MSIGFTTQMSAIARPGSSPHQYRMLKHYQGIPVATYRDGRQVDDGFTAYAWQVASGSNPAPLAVHEVFAPAEVAQAARTGYQQIMPSDTRTARLRLLPLCPEPLLRLPRCATSSPRGRSSTLGPSSTRTWASRRKHRNRYRIALGATSDAPIKEAVLYAEGQPNLRWTPNAPRFRETVDGYHAWQHHWLLTVTDAQGRRAVSPGLRTVPHRFIYRCGDRQNWLGYIPHQYTGTNLPWLEIHLPVKETHEGDAVMNFVKGDLLAPMCEFPLASDRVCVSDWLLGQRYVNAEKLEDIAYDAAPMRTTVPSRLYEGKVRVSMITPHAGGPDLQVYEVKLKTKMDATRTGEGVWPWFVEVSGKYRQTNGAAGDITPAVKLDLQPGDQLGNVVVLSPGMRLEGGRLGLIAPTETTLKAGTTFSATMLVMGLGVAGIAERGTFYSDPPDFLHAADVLKLTRGTLGSGIYAVPVVAAENGAAGTIKATSVAADPLLLIRGLNPRWVAGVWRSDAPTSFTDQFGFADGIGVTTLDVTRDAKFYAGNLVTADNSDLWMDIESWTPDKIVVAINNPTDKPITATVQTPAEITGLKALRQQVTVPAGSTARLKG